MHCIRQSILGPLVVEAGGISVVPSGRQPRTVLAVLLVRANQLVRRDELEEEIWGAGGPPSARTAVQTYIMRLRRAYQSALGLSASGVARDVLVTSDQSYLLRVDPATSDSHRYETLAAEGGRALTDGRYEEADRLLAAALRLWRGPALADVSTGPVLSAEAARLDMSLMFTRVQRINAALHLGRDHEVLGDLSVLAGRHLYDDAVQMQYMTALYRTGFREEALRVYNRHHRALITDLGLEPSAQLQMLHRSILAADREAVVPSLTPPPSPRFATASRG